MNRPLLFLCPKGFQLYRYKSNNNNFGVSKRLKLIGNSSVDKKVNDIDDETLENLEENFHNARGIRTHHEKEIQNIRRNIDFKRIERMFFEKTKYPNMLTWGDKEQIRKLNDTEPEYWTVERLAEGFPATPEIIQKLLKNSWKPENEKKREKHDSSVAENWKNFKLGKLKIDDKVLVEHLKKFSSREHVISNPESCLVQPSILQKPLKHGEFSLIIQHDKGEKTQQEIEEQGNSPRLTEVALLPVTRNDSDTFILPNDKSPSLTHRHYTLPKLREELESSNVNSSISPSKNTQEVSRFSLRQLNEELCGDLSINESEIDKKNVFASIKVVESISDYPLSIDIPKNKWKNGAIYRINDCFYNCHGEFLYRVPGMVS